MSTNLKLGTSPYGTFKATLIQTPSDVTQDILEYSTKLARLHAYFQWAKRQLSAGAFLDHKIEVLQFLVEHPEADWGVQ